MILVEPRLIPQYLPQGATTALDVRSIHGALVMSVCRREAQVLADYQQVIGVVSKHGHLRYLRLTSSARAAQRVLRRISKDGRSIAAEDNYTVRRVTVPRGPHGGGVYFEPVMRRADAFRRS